MCVCVRLRERMRERKAREKGAAQSDTQSTNQPFIKLKARFMTAVFYCHPVTGAAFSEGTGDYVARPMPRFTSALAD